MSLCRADKVLLGGCAAMVGSAVAFGPNFTGLGLPASVFATVLADGIFRATSSTLYPTIAHGPRSSRRVALTFDDGPDPEVTPRVLEVLDQYGARATFFMIGRNLERSMSVGERVAREGHEIGNHSWQHGYMQNVYPVSAQLMDMERNETLIRSLTKSDVRSHYRAPVGLKSPRFARAAHRLDLKVVAWSVHSRDTIDSNPERIARRVLARIRPGDIVLMHDGHQSAGAHRPQCEKAAEIILQGLGQRALQAVSVRELLEGD